MDQHPWITYSFHHDQRWTKVHESYIHSTTAKDEPRTTFHEWHSFYDYRWWTKDHGSWIAYSFHDYQRWTKAEVHESHFHFISTEDGPRLMNKFLSITTKDGPRLMNKFSSITTKDGPRPRFMNHILIPFQLKMDQGWWINFIPLQPKMDQGSRII